MSPSAGLGIDDLNLEVPTDKLLQIKRRRRQKLLFPTSGRPDHCSVRQNIHAGLADGLASPDEKVEVSELQRERRRRQGSH